MGVNDDSGHATNLSIQEIHPGQVSMKSVFAANDEDPAELPARAVPIRNKPEEPLQTACGNNGQEITEAPANSENGNHGTKRVSARRGAPDAQLSRSAAFKRQGSFCNVQLFSLLSAARMLATKAEGSAVCPNCVCLYCTRRTVRRLGHSGPRPLCRSDLVCLFCTHKTVWYLCHQRSTAVLRVQPAFVSSKLV